MTVSVTQGATSFRVAEYILHVPEVGAWDAEVRVESPAAGDPAPASGEVTISDGTTTWVGWVTEALPDGACVALTIIGGRDGLRTATTPRHWAATTSAPEVLAALCGDAGEQPGDVGPQLASWRAHGGSLATEVRSLARWASGGDWRIGPAGTVDVAARAWAGAEAPGGLMRIDAGATVYECPGLPDLAGRTVDGQRIGEVLYVSTEGKPAEARCWQTVAAARPGSTGIVGATLDAQSEARADVTLDDGTVMTDLPMWQVGGYRPMIAPGSRVLVVNMADDPRASFILAAPWDAETIEMVIAAQDKVTIDAPAVDAAGGFAPVLRSGDPVFLLDAPPPLGMPPPGPAMLAGFLPTTPVFLYLAPPIVALPAGPPGVGPSGVKA